MLSAQLNADEANYKKLSLSLPKGLSLDHSVIYSSDKSKIGELISKENLPYKSGKDFVSAFKKGFSDDGKLTKYLSDGVSASIYWVCRQGMWEDGSGNFGIWYARRFWVSGPILTMYSHKSCEENFNQALSIARTLKQN